MVVAGRMGRSSSADLTTLLEEAHEAAVKFITFNDDIFSFHFTAWILSFSSLEVKSTIGKICDFSD